MKHLIDCLFVTLVFSLLLIFPARSEADFQGLRLYDTGEQIFTIGQFWGENDRPLYDFNGDGVGDFFFLSFLTGDVATGFIVHGTPQGGFSDPVQTNVQLVPDYDFCQYTILDMNGDGLDDIVVSGWVNFPLYLNMGDGNFDLSSVGGDFFGDYYDCWSGGEDFRMHPAVSYDCNSDGRDEFMAYPMMPSEICGPCALLMLENVAGGFDLDVATLLEGPHEEYCALYISMDHKVGYTTGDFNGDGYSDILQMTRHSGSTIFTRVDGCQFSRFYHIGGGLGNVRTGDFNGDGIDDLVMIVETYPGRFIVFYGNPVEITLQTYDGWLEYNVDQNYLLHCVADFDGDGFDDIAVSDSTVASDNYWEIYIHYSAGDTFLARCDTLELRSFFSYPQGLHLFSEDLDSDSRDDLFYIARGDRIGVLLQEGPVATLLQRFDITLDPLGRPRIEWEVCGIEDVASFTISRAYDSESYTAVATLESDHSSSSYCYVDGDLESIGGGIVTYRLETTKTDGSVLMLAEDGITVPRSELTLHQNFPNPFNPGTAISFVLPERGAVTLDIYDVSGRLVRRLIDADEMEAGLKTFGWDGRNDAGRPVSSGIYYCRLAAGKAVSTIKMILLR